MKNSLDIIIHFTCLVALLLLMFFGIREYEQQRFDKRIQCMESGKSAGDCFRIIK